MTGRPKIFGSEQPTAKARAWAWASLQEVEAEAAVRPEASKWGRALGVVAVEAQTEQEVDRVVEHPPWVCCQWLPGSGSGREPSSVHTHVGEIRFRRGTLSSLSAFFCGNRRERGRLCRRRPSESLGGDLGRSSLSSGGKWLA